MKATSGLHPDEFVQRMESHWINELNNVPNKALKDSWHQIAETFEYHIHNHDYPEKAKKWTVLSPPTGAGKSESIVVYGAMLSSRAKDDHPAMLVVTRLIDDCNMMAERINKFGERDTAIAYHSDVSNKINLNELRNWPVVVITHRAYEMALDFLGHEGRIEQTWPYFHEYDRNGHLPQGSTKEYPDQNPFVSRRRLVVIDECLDIVDHYAVSLEGLRQTLGEIPKSIRDKYEPDIMAIEDLIELFEEIDRRTKGEQPNERMLLQKPLEVKNKNGEIISHPDLSKLIEALRIIRFDRQIGKDDLLECERLRRRHESRLKSLHYLFRSWASYSKHSIDHQFNTARLLVPEGIKGCVVMDATASTNVVYELHSDSYRIKPPAGSRNYSNVTLHVSRGHRVGKTYMNKESKTLSNQLIYDLNNRLKDRNVLIVTHKKVEPLLKRFDTTFILTTGHWGKIDGSNQWQHCDTVVIFGIPYLPKTWTSNIFMALQGAQDTEWLQDGNARTFGKHADIRQALELGMISTSIIQAINRVRCRKTIDDHGNCKRTDVYIMLTGTELDKAILKDIIRMMPEIVIKNDWDYKPQKKRVKASKFEQALAKFFENMSISRLTPSKISKELGMAMRTMRTLIEKCKDPDSELFKVMERNGIKYEVTGSGQKLKAYFEKI